MTSVLESLRDALPGEVDGNNSEGGRVRARLLELLLARV